MNRFEADQILKEILNIGREMMICGAEVWRAEDSMQRMCNSYGFVNVNLWLIASNIQATIETDQGDIITQIRNVAATSLNYDRLDKLNNLSRYICANTPNSTEVREKLEAILNAPKQKTWMHYAGGIIGGAGYGILFGCSMTDGLICAFASALLIFVGGIIGKNETNPLRYNAIVAGITEFFVLFVVGVLHIGDNYSHITIGFVMLLISGLGFTNGIRDLLNRDVITGIINLSTSVLGAVGIAVGIAVPILFMKGVL